ncbi:MAG: hypothetical protein ACUVQS_06745 [Candidatus Bipolaricaulaceae bacterium]
MGKRAFVLLLVSSFLASGQAISGSWSAKISLLPPPAGLSSLEFALQGDLFGWTVGGKAEFLGADGWVWQTFTAQGAFGSMDTKWTLLFGPLAPAFLYALGETHLPISGLGVTVYSAYVGPNVPPYVFTGGPAGGMVVEASSGLNGVDLSIELGIGARKQDFTIIYSGVGTYTKNFPVDPFPGGLEFTYLKATAKDLPLCCGISLDLAFTFTKEKGFAGLAATLKSIPLCCGIALDAEVTFTTTEKRVALLPSWEGITGCFTVYGDVLQSVGRIEGLALYGWKIRCELGDCSYAEFLTALDVDKMEEILGDIFQNTEFEYLKLGFCGQGCCGGQWRLGLNLFFRPSGALWGLSRVALAAEVPVMANLTVELGLSAAVGAQAGLTVGWTFTF